MEKWLIMTIVGAVAALGIYGSKAFFDAQTGQNLVQNQEFIKQQIDKKFYELDAKRNLSAIKTQNTITHEVGDILTNLTSHRRITNMTFNATTEQNRLLKEILTVIEYNANKSLYNQEHYFQPYFNETFQKIFDALNITDTGSNFILNQSKIEQQEETKDNSFLKLKKNTNKGLHLGQKK